MATNRKEELNKTQVDEEYLMNVISGDTLVSEISTEEVKKNLGSKEKLKIKTSYKVDYAETFIINRYPSGRNGKVVYIRPEYHEILIRIVQLTKDEKITLYSYIDNILDQHFKDYGEDITTYFNKHFKPIL